MINLMVCDLFMFLNIKNNPKVNCLFHTLRPIAGFTLGFSDWSLLWVLRRREALINDGVGNVYRWDSYTETAAFSTYLFYCFTKHDDKYVTFFGVGLVVCWVGGSVLLGFFSSLTITPFLCYHSLCTFRVLPFIATETLQSCYSISSIHAVSFWWTAFWAASSKRYVI